VSRRNILFANQRGSGRGLIRIHVMSTSDEMRTNALLFEIVLALALVLLIFSDLCDFGGCEGFWPFYASCGGGKRGLITLLRRAGHVRF